MDESSSRSEANDCLISGIDHFSAVLRNEAVMLNAVAGLRSITEAARSPGGISPHARDALSARIAECAPHLVEVCGSDLAEDHIVYGLTVARSLVGLFGLEASSVDPRLTADVVDDQVDQVALIAAQIEAVYRRQAIRARGDALHRLLDLRKAEFASAPDRAAFN